MRIVYRNILASRDCEMLNAAQDDGNLCRTDVRVHSTRFPFSNVSCWIHVIFSLCAPHTLIHTKSHNHILFNFNRINKYKLLFLCPRTKRSLRNWINIFVRSEHSPDLNATNCTFAPVAFNFKTFSRSEQKVPKKCFRHTISFWSIDSRFNRNYFVHD